MYSFNYHKKPNFFHIPFHTVAVPKSFRKIVCIIVEADFCITKNKMKVKQQLHVIKAKCDFFNCLYL